MGQREEAVNYSTRSVGQFSRVECPGSVSRLSVEDLSERVGCGGEGGEVLPYRTRTIEN
jgi:hypothetical protein